MVRPGNQYQGDCPSNIQEESKIVVEGILADGYHGVSNNHEDKGNTAGEVLPVEVLFKDGNKEGCHCQNIDKYADPEEE